MKKILKILFIIIFYYLPVTSQAEIKPIIEGNTDAKIKIIIFESLTCSHCASFHKKVYPSLKEDFIEKELVSIEFKRTDKLSDRIKDVDVIHDLMIHDIDLSIFFNGKIKKVYANGYKNKNKISYVTATLIHDNNVISKIEASRITQKKIRQINITTLKEYISANLISKEIKINQQTNLNFSMKRNRPVTITSNEQKVLVDQNEALKKELLEFLKLCRNKKVKVPNLIESLYILRICKKIEESIEKNL